MPATTASASQFDNLGAAYFVGSVALAIILFDSGYATRLATLRLAALPALALSTIGVVITAALVGVAARLLFGFAWMQGLLLGVIVAPTDAAAVFFLLRVGGITLRDRVRSTLEVESGTNDPIAIFLTLSLVAPRRRIAALGTGGTGSAIARRPCAADRGRRWSSASPAATPSSRSSTAPTSSRRSTRSW